MAEAVANEILTGEEPEAKPLSSQSQTNEKAYAPTPEQSLRNKAKDRITRITEKRPVTEGDFRSLLSGLQNEVVEREAKKNPPSHNEIRAAVRKSQREEARDEILGGVLPRPQEQTTIRHFHFPRPHIPHPHFPDKK